MAESKHYRHKLTGKVQELSEDAASAFPEHLEEVDPNDLDSAGTDDERETRRSQRAAAQDKE